RRGHRRTDAPQGGGPLDGRHLSPDGAAPAGRLAPGGHRAHPGGPPGEAAAEPRLAGARGAGRRGLAPVLIRGGEDDVAGLPGGTIPIDFVTEEETMAESVYKIIELVGTSTESWEKAAAAAVGRASKSLRDLRIAEVSTLDMQIDNGKVKAY